MAVRFPYTAHPVDPVETPISHLIQVGKHGHNPGELSKSRGVAIDNSSNNIYVVEHFPARVSIFSKSGDFLNSFTHEHMDLPWGVAIYRNSVFVSDIGVHGILKFKIVSDIRINAYLVGKGSDNGKFNEPFQLTVSDNGEVFVADCNNHRIQILDESLHFKRSIKLDSMRYPRDVKLTNSEVFVLTDSSPCVIVFSHAGERLRSMVTRGEGMQVANPWFFCLDTHHNLIISDFDAKYVKIFSQDGRFLDSIEVGTKLYSGPLGVALSRQFEIVILVLSEPLQLKIYSC